MAIHISLEDQKSVNELRLDLAQVTIDLSALQVHPNDLKSRDLKEQTIERMRSVARRMDALGIQHSCARRCANADG